MTILIFLIVSLSSSFVNGFFPLTAKITRGMLASKSSSSLQMRQSTYEDINQISYNSIALSGFISKLGNVATPFPFLRIHENGKYEKITAISDDIRFAKKRLANPDTIYSGLFDVLEHAVVADGDDAGLEAALKGNEAWLCFNITSAQLPAYASVAAKAGVRRALFGVRLSPEEEKIENLTFENSCTEMTNAGVNFTIVKFGEVRPMAESRYPYRVRLGNETLPQPTFEKGLGQVLSDKDLFRVLIESVDLVKTFNTVYCIGPGTFLDSEVLVYLKAKGYPERVQVSIMMGSRMDGIERRYEDEVERVAKLNPVKPGTASSASIVSTNRIQSTGFFT